MYAKFFQIALLCAYLSCLLYTPVASVQVFNKSTLQDALDTGSTFVEFVLSDCKNCDYLNAVEKFSNITFNAGRIDCDRFQILCAAYNITKFPTVIFFEQGGTPWTKYEFPQETLPLKQFMQLQSKHSNPAKASRNGGSTQLTTTTFWLYTKNSPYFILFCNKHEDRCHEFFPLWAEIAHEYKRSRVVIAEFDCGVSKNFCDDLGITDVPHMAWVEKSEIKSNYEGPLELSPIRNFISRMLRYNNKTIQKNHCPAWRPKMLLILCLFLLEVVMVTCL